MRVTTNTKLIRRKAKFGTYASLGGIAILALGMVASFRPNIAWMSLVALILGFILAQYGNHNLRRWGRSPRPDQIIEESLKGLDDKYHFYAWSLPAPNVLLTPHGIYSFITRDQTGAVSVNGANWKTKFTLGRALLMFAQEGLGNPTQEAQAHATRLQEWIRTKLPDTQVNVQPAVVFIDPRAELQITDPVVPVMDPKGIKKWLRGSGKADFFKGPDLRALEALFDEAAAANVR